ncbi:ATP-binding protein, partial [Altibacter sp.]
KGSPEAIEEAIETIGTSLNELRSLSKLINPSALNNLSLVEALQQEVERFNRLKYLEATISYTGASFFIDNKKEIIIFRMLQEFFTNTVKHSKASKLMVAVDYSNKVLQIVAQDNGIGFDTSENSIKKGIGLSNIRNRAKLIGADVKITSIPNEGTKFSLTYIN